MQTVFDFHVIKPRFKTYPDGNFDKQAQKKCKKCNSFSSRFSNQKFPKPEKYLLFINK